MRQFRLSQYQFSSGEATPLYKRPDLKEYYTTLRECRNAIPLHTGPVTKRPGTRMHVEVKDSTKTTRLRKFINSQNDKYILEIGPGYIRFHTYDSNGDPLLVESGGPPAPVEVVTPYAEADIPGLWMTQVADILWLFHPDYQTRTLSHTSATSWTLNTFSYVDGPYLRLNTSSTKTLEPAATTGTGIVVTAVGHTPFTANDVGRAIRFENSGATSAGWAVIVGYTSSTQVTVDIKQTLPATGPTPDWKLGAFATSVGWPVLGIFQEGRLAVGKNGDVSSPVTVFFSEVQGFTATQGFFQPTRYTDRAVLADMAITIPIASDGANDIKWMSPGAVLSMGTANSEWTIGAADRTSALSPTNYQVAQHTRRGSVGTAGAPLRINASTLFVDRSGTAVREFVYSFDKDAYDAEDMTELVAHLTNTGIEQLLYAQSPNSLVIARLTDGTVLALPYEVAGTKLGGALWTFHGEVKSIDIVPTKDNKNDAIWLIVERDVDGNTVQFIEVMQQPFFQGDPLDAWYLDAASVYTGVATDTLSGLDHLEGEMVLPVCNGAPQALVEVTGGEIVLPNEYTHVLVGVPYTGRLVLPSYNAALYAIGTGPDTSMGQNQRFNRMQFDVFETGRFVAGLFDDQLDPVNQRTLAEGWNAPETFKTMILDFTLGGSMDRDPSVIIESRDPVPFTLRGVVIDGSFSTD